MCFSKAPVLEWGAVSCCRQLPECCGGFYLPTVAKITLPASLRALRDTDQGALDPSPLFCSLSWDLCHRVQITWLFHWQIPCQTTPALVHRCEICSWVLMHEKCFPEFVMCSNIVEQGLKLAYSWSHLGTDDMGKSKMENCVSAGFPL